MQDFDDLRDALVEYMQSTPAKLIGIMSIVFSVATFSALGWTTLLLMILAFNGGAALVVTIGREELRRVLHQRRIEQEKRRQITELSYAARGGVPLTRKANPQFVYHPPVRKVVEAGLDAVEEVVTTTKPQVATEKFPVVSMSKLPVKYQQKEPVINWATTKGLHFRPRLSVVTGTSILGLGIRGSGKSNALAKFLEQIFQEEFGPYCGVVFDHKNDYGSLYPLCKNYCRIGGAADWRDARKHEGHYWVVTEKNAKQVGYSIPEHGVQLVLQLSSYKDKSGNRDYNLAARIMTNIILGITQWTEEREPKDCVPCLLALDEAQQYLPQTIGDTGISKEESQDLLNAFAQAGDLGRTFGLTPIYFTQRAAAINKRVINNCELYVFMKQTLPQDTKRCMDVIGEVRTDDGKVVTKDDIASSEVGEGWVYVDGEICKVKFDERASEHRCITPDSENARKRYKGRRLPDSTLSAYFIDADDAEEKSSWRGEPEDGEYAEEDTYSGRDTDPLEEGDMEDYTPPDYQETVKQPIAQSVVKPKTDLEKVVEFFTAHPDTSCRAAGDNKLISGFGRSKVNELYKLAVEQGLLPTRDRVLSE